MQTIAQKTLKKKMYSKTIRHAEEETDERQIFLKKKGRGKAIPLSERVQVCGISRTVSAR